jgi:Mn-dependent DtxR family transcriptional regulator
MLQEIVIIFDEKNSSKKGTYFEKLINNIFIQQRYKVQGNVNFTGMEFDLLCQHKDRDNEQILVECKAKDKLSSDEITKFAFNVSHKKIKYGYFLYTKNFAHQVQGIINEFKGDVDKRYDNLYFWNSEKIIELLIEFKQIKKFEFPMNKFDLKKVTLFFSFEGFYYIPLFSDTIQPKYFSIFNSKTLENINDNETIEHIKKYIKDIEQLTFYSFETKRDNKVNISKLDDEIETIAEVRESQSWHDLKPASFQYFIGRDEFINKITNLLKDIIEKKISDKVFYIDGKSGWGKSSLLVALRGKYRNKYYKNRYFTYVVDSRSANSQSFISLAFTSMLEKATKENFIPKKLSSISIPSHFDILGAKEINDLEKYLEVNNKALVLVFDQFEDIFRKESILKSFFKLLTDINLHESNIILGFSWKSETIYSADEKEVTALLSQSKEHSIAITMSEFGMKESTQLIKQLEKDISEKLDDEFKRRIIDTSQGFPWLIKKLCVHIYKQLQEDNITLDDLFSQDLNVESLFKKDLEDCNDKEIRALRLIAQRAYEGNMFDRIEVNETIPESIITDLTNKNLIIKTATKYNIYWDIFRDYLVTDEVPKVGENYLIRIRPNSAFDILTVFKKRTEMTLTEVSSYVSNTEGTVGNQLRELRSFGLIEYKDEKYSLKDTNFEINEENFKNYLKEKLQKHTFYLELIKIKDKKIGLEEVIEIIKNKNNTGSKYKEKTLLDYAQKFLVWLSYADIIIGNIDPKLIQQAKNANSFAPQAKPDTLLKFFKDIQENIEYKETAIITYLRALGLISYQDKKITLTEDGYKAKKNQSIFFNKALKTEKIAFSYREYCEDINISLKDFKPKIKELLTNSTHKVYIDSTSRKLYEWSELIYKDKHAGLFDIEVN